MDPAFEDESHRGEEDGESFTMGEYLKEVEDRELEVDLVLGGDEGNECTYNNGYMKRQAIFSCLTCTPDGNAGVCIACSLSCHDGYEIVELWTKRNFRCDCGNSKFGEFYCKILPSKDTENFENLYNHNFKGLYCTCDRPYPDPDVEEQVGRMQCCFCEDWFHEEHIGLDSSDENRDRAELSVLDNVGHVEKIEILNGIEDIKDEFCSFLGSFDSSKVVTSADVHQIFDNLKKRRRVE